MELLAETPERGQIVSRIANLPPCGLDWRMIPRNLAPRIHDLATRWPVVTITGPRQSGKTTLTKMAFPEHAHVSLESPDVREFAASDARGFLREHGDGAVLDEVQRVPELLSYLQVPFLPTNGSAATSTPTSSATSARSRTSATSVPSRPSCVSAPAAPASCLNLLDLGSDGGISHNTVAGRDGGHDAQLRGVLAGGLGDQVGLIDAVDRQDQQARRRSGSTRNSCAFCSVAQ